MILIIGAGSRTGRALARLLRETGTRGTNAHPFGPRT